MNDIDKDIYKKYGQLNIKNNTQISQINNIEINNNNSSILNGEFYYDGIGASVLPADQIEPTVYALQKAKQITTQAILGNFITSSFSRPNRQSSIVNRQHFKLYINVLTYQPDLMAS